MFQKIKLFFNREDLNTGRQINIDYGKALAIISMVLIHIMTYPLYTEGDHGFGYLIGYIFGGFMAAPLFMIAMGVGLAYTKNNSPKDIIIRGLKIFAMAYILNICRSAYIIPKILCSNDTTENIIKGIIYNIFNGDILTFAGLAMIFFGFLKMIKKNSNFTILLVGIGLNIIASIFRIIENDNFTLALTLGFFIPVDFKYEPLIVFQLCSWFIFVAAGNFFAVMLKKVKNLDKFYLITGIVAAIITAVAFVCDYKFGLNGYFGLMPDRDPEYYANWVYALIGISVTIVQFSLFHFICKLIPQSFSKKVCALASALNEIYIISWIIILDIYYPIINLLYGEKVQLWTYLVAFAIVMPISTYIGLLWYKSKIEKVKREKLCVAK